MNQEKDPVRRAIKLVMAHAKAALDVSGEFLSKYPTIGNAPIQDRDEWTFWSQASHTPPGTQSILQSLRIALADEQEQEHVSDAELQRLASMAEILGTDGKVHFDWSETRRVADQWLQGTGAALQNDKFKRTHPGFVRLVHAFENLKHFKDTTFRGFIERQKEIHAESSKEFKIETLSAPAIIRRVGNELTLLSSLSSPDEAADAMIRRFHEGPSIKQLLVRVIEGIRADRGFDTAAEEEINRLKIPP